jgi:hypothetical protein
MDFVEEIDLPGIANYEFKNYELRIVLIGLFKQ